ncbi:DUF1637 domain-containing protein [Nicoletella semolina]|uniref:DUF1637 domain-containing protein n=1 Tax=Nicoletella semolina TaxID=271160 RepID=UPI00105231A3|nr:DUF1637 domain-containing protein [Nicoletella semolina]
MKKDEAIPRHHHEGSEIIFTVLQERITVKLDGSKKHTLESGNILQFSGDHLIESEKVSENTEIMATLVYHQDHSHTDEASHKHKH